MRVTFSVVGDRHRNCAGQCALGNRLTGLVVGRFEWQDRFAATRRYRPRPLGRRAVGRDCGGRGQPGCQPKGGAAGAAGVGKQPGMANGGCPGEQEAHVAHVRFAVGGNLEIQLARVDHRIEV